MKNQQTSSSSMLKVFGGVAVLLLLVGVMYLQQAPGMQPLDNKSDTAMMDSDYNMQAEAASRCNVSQIGQFASRAGVVPPRGARSVYGLPAKMAAAVDVWVPTGAYSMDISHPLDKAKINYSMHLYLPPELEGKCAYLASIDKFHTTRFWGAEILGKHAAKGDFGEATEQVYVPTSTNDSKDGYYVIVENEGKVVGYYWGFGRNP